MVVLEEALVDRLRQILGGLAILRLSAQARAVVVALARLARGFAVVAVEVERLLSERLELPALVEMAVLAQHQALAAAAYRMLAAAAAESTQVEGVV